MNDSKMGRGALEHLLQGVGEPFETQGDGKSSEVNYQREHNSSEDIIPTHGFATTQVKRTILFQYMVCHAAAKQ
jgi:hypothetical protein